MEAISINVYLNRSYITVRAIKADEAPGFWQQTMHKFKTPTGRSNWTDILAVVNISKTKIIRSKGKLWDLLGNGDTVWFVTEEEWKEYCDHVLPIEDQTFRHGKRLVARHPNSLSYDRLCYFVNSFFEVLRPIDPTRKFMAPPPPPPARPVRVLSPPSHIDHPSPGKRVQTSSKSDNNEKVAIKLVKAGLQSVQKKSPYPSPTRPAHHNPYASPYANHSSPMQYTPYMTMEGGVGAGVGDTSSLSDSDTEGAGTGGVKARDPQTHHYHAPHAPHAAQYDAQVPVSEEKLDPPRRYGGKRQQLQDPYHQEVHVAHSFSPPAPKTNTVSP